MPNVNLTEELERFVSSKVESGDYESASEIISAALKAFEGRKTNTVLN